MRVKAKQDVAQWASKWDPRITHIGTFLRSTRMHELAQLINVISGDLRLIGARPEGTEIAEGLAQENPDYCVRLWLPPGLSN